MNFSPLKQNFQIFVFIMFKKGRSRGCFGINHFERQLLLFSHSESSQIEALYFDESNIFQDVWFLIIKKEENFIKLDPLDLNGATARGFVFYKGAFSKDEKFQMVQPRYQNQIFDLLKGPRLLVLDSKGLMHHFEYYDTKYFESILVDPTNPLWTEWSGLLNGITNKKISKEKSWWELWDSRISDEILCFPENKVHIFSLKRKDLWIDRQLNLLFQAGLKNEKLENQIFFLNRVRFDEKTWKVYFKSIILQREINIHLSI